MAWLFKREGGRGGGGMLVAHVIIAGELKGNVMFVRYMLRDCAGPSVLGGSIRAWRGTVRA